MERQAVELPDGRCLAYAEYGDPNGVPVFNCHGGLTSRLDIRGCDAVAMNAGVRVISPDRPGIGRSDRLPGRRPLDWPGDIVALADVLEVERFAVLGWSAGGPYAAACGSALNHRVTAVGLVASSIPGDWPGMKHEINLMDRVFLRLSSHAPMADRLAFRAIGSVARVAPATFRRLSLITLDRPSRKLVMRAPASDFSGPIAEGMRDPSGVVDDYRVINAAWGFDPAEIHLPVTVWQGDEDSFVPTRWAERLATRIPGAELRLCPGEGHFMALGRYREIFDALLDRRAC